ncbi:MAG: SBBP repeat-containing protein [Bacteroidota bacterium]
MKTTRTLLAMLFVCNLFVVSVNAQQVSWALSIGNAGSDQGYDISSDSAGNIYVTGWFSGTTQFGSQTLTSYGLQDIFIASYDGNGNLNWVRQGGGSGNDVSAGIATAANGESYITGWFADTARFGDSLVVSNGSLDMFVAKYDASGAIQWVRHGGGVLDDYGNRVTLMSDGGVALAGSFKDTLTAEGSQIISSGNRDILLCRYEANGQLVWLKGVGGSGEDRGYGISQDADSNCFVTGLFTGNVNFGSTNLTCNSLFAAFVGKVSAQGDFVWAVKGDGGANDFARGFGVVTDPAGNAVVNGFFSGILRMGGSTLNATGGQYDQDNYLIKFNSGGNVVWAKRTGGPGTDQGTDLFMTAGGEILETGFFQGTAYFDATSLISAGLSDIYLAKYDSAGIVLWASGFGGPGNEFSYGVTGTGSTIFTTGVLTGFSLFGNIPLVSSGGNDVFIARIEVLPTGMVENRAEAGFNLYPNPSNGDVHISLPHRPYRLQLFDDSGRLVWTRSGVGGEMQVNWTGMPAGLYRIVAMGREDVYSLPVIFRE